MIKKILLVSLIATTGLIGVQKIQPPHKGNGAHLVVKNMMVENGKDDAQIGADGTSDAELLNQSTIEVLDDVDHEFAGMFVNGFYKANAVVGSTNKVALHGSNTEVCNYYTNSADNMVFIIDTNNRLVSHMAITNCGNVDDADITAATDLMHAPAGYSIDSGLYYGDNQMFTAETAVTEDMILRSKLTYDASYATYQVAAFGDNATISVDGGVAETEVDVDFDKMVTVNSTSENFKCWQIGNRVVSYSKEYKFSVYTDVVIKEVLLADGEVVDAADKAVINLYHDEVGDDMDTLFVCGYELPDGYAMVETGVLFGGETYETAEHRVMANSISSNNEFAVKYGNEIDQLDKDTHVAYLVYEDTAGDIHMVYDNGYGYEQLYLGDAVGSIAGINAAITSSYDIIDAEGGDVYGVNGVDGIKMGSSTNPGVLSLTLPDGKFTDKVIVNAKAYDVVNEKTMTINDTNSVTTLTDEFEYYTINLDESSNEVNFDTGVGATRFYINSIEIYYEDRDVEVGERNANTALYAIEIGEDDTIIDTTTLPSTSMDYDILWTLDGTTITELNSTNFIDQFSDFNDDVIATISGTTYSKTINLTSIATDTTKNNIISWMGTQTGFDDPNNVTENLVLPSEYSAYDSTISLTNWTSDNAAIVIDGDTGTITRGATDTTVILSYDFTIAGISYTGQSTLIVKQYVAPAFLTYDFTTITSSKITIDDNAEMKTTLDGINATVNAAKLDSISEVVGYLYYGVDSCAKISCLKFSASTSSADGVFTMNFAVDTIITKVVVTGCGWTSGTNKLTVGGVEHTFTNATAWDAGGDTTNYNIQEYEYDIVDASSVKFQADNRVLVTNIAIYTV